MVASEPQMHFILGRLVRSYRCTRCGRPWTFGHADKGCPKCTDSCCRGPKPRPSLHMTLDNEVFVKDFEGDSDEEFREAAERMFGG